MSDIFISYDRLDRSRVENLVKTLEKHGLSVWWDRRILPGKSFDKVIQEAIDSSKCMIVVWSKQSIESDWVKEEASEGIRRGMLIPILIDDVKIPLGFGRRQAARLVDWQGTQDDPEIDQIIKSIEEKLDRYSEDNDRNNKGSIEESNEALDEKSFKPALKASSKSKSSNSLLESVRKISSLLWLPIVVLAVLLILGAIYYIVYLLNTPSGMSFNSNSSNNASAILPDSNPSNTNLPKWELDKTLVGHSDPVWSVAFSADGKTVVSGSEDKTVRVWETMTGKEKQTLKEDSPVNSIAIAPDEKTLASACNDKTIKLWNIATGKKTMSLKGHSDQVYSVSFSPEGTLLASGSKDMTIRLWNIQTGALLSTLMGHSERVTSVAFSPDSKTLASSSVDGKVKLWDVQTGALKTTLDADSSYVYCVAFSPDGKLVASGNHDLTVRLWDSLSGALVQTLRGHNERIFAIAFSPDGRLLASGSVDNFIKLWDTISWDLRQTLKNHTDVINSLVFSTDGKLLASGSRDKTIKLWIK